MKTVNELIKNAENYLNDIEQRKIVNTEKLTIYYVKELKRVSFNADNSAITINIDARFKRLFDVLREFKFPLNEITRIYDLALKYNKI